MNRFDTVRRAQLHENDEVVFLEQWHAQVISVVELLVAEGKINPEDWSQTLSAELKRRGLQNAKDSDTDACYDEHYYEACLSALEQILYESHLVTQLEVDKRVNNWRQAYLSTPHGSPVTLKK